jgi:hypothetical protein
LIWIFVITPRQTPFVFVKPAKYLCRETHKVLKTKLVIDKKRPFVVQLLSKIVDIFARSCKSKNKDYYTKNKKITKNDKSRDSK